MGGKNGFRVSTSKTVMAHFSNMRGVRVSPDIRLESQTIAYENSAKILGMNFDNRLNVGSHIDSLKSKCTKAVLLLKALAGPKWGGGSEQKT